MESGQGTGKKRQKVAGKMGNPKEADEDGETGADKKRKSEEADKSTGKKVPKVAGKTGNSEEAAQDSAGGEMAAIATSIEGAAKPTEKVFCTSAPDIRQQAPFCYRCK